MKRDRLLDGVIDIYSNPGRYIIVRNDDHNSPQRARLRGECVTTLRTNDRIEFLFHSGENQSIHPLINHLVTLPTTIDALERCRSLSTRLSRFASSLFCNYRVECVRFIGQVGVGDTLLADIALQSLPVGDILNDCKRQYSRCSLLRAVDLLERTFIEFNISFKELNPQDIIVGLDGRLYPFRYKHIQFDRSEDSQDCELLREWISINFDTLGEIYNTTPMEPYPGCSSTLYPGHISIGAYHEDRIAIEESTGWGFVDGANRIVIQPQYKSVGSFREGRAVVESQNGWGIINLWGDEVIPAIYESIGYDERTGIIVARKNGLWAYFNYSGEQQTPFQFEHPNEEISRRELADLIKSIAEA